MKKKERLVVGALILISLILLGLVLYFIVVPSISGRVISSQQQPNSEYQNGYNAAVMQMVQEASTCKPVFVYAGNFNMSLIWIDCLTNPVSLNITG
jgi:hypothetical protein